MRTKDILFFCSEFGWLEIGGGHRGGWQGKLCLVSMKEAVNGLELVVRVRLSTGTRSLAQITASRRVERTELILRARAVYIIKQGYSIDPNGRKRLEPALVGCCVPHDEGHAPSTEQQSPRSSLLLK